MADLENIKESVDKIKSILTQMDGNGVPLCYTPREWREILKQVNETLTSLASSLEKVAFGQSDMIQQVRSISGALHQEEIIRERWQGAFDQILSGVKVKDCQDCPFDSETEKKLIKFDKFIDEYKPKFDESYGFMVKIKYGIWPALVGIVGAIVTAVLKIVELFSKGGGTP